MKKSVKKGFVRSVVKKDDSVVVTAGADRGKRGKVLFVDRSRGRIVVEGINKKKKFVRPSQQNPKGGAISLEFPINISNVLLFCEKCKKGVRLGVSSTSDARQRVCRKCGKSID